MLLQEKIKKAYFSGGCFWCMESIFEAQQGVIDAISGYAGGEMQNPSYEDVLSDITGHREAIEVQYNHNLISYKKLLHVFWRNIDPTDNAGQFADRGFHYTTAIFYRNNVEKIMAQETKQELIDSKIFTKEIVTEIIPLKNFYKAEDYHQNYHQNFAQQYKRYVMASGRLQFSERFWKMV